MVRVADDGSSARLTTGRPAARTLRLMTSMLAPPNLLVFSSDDGWDDARRAWNLAVDQRPAAVALPATAQDVVAVVRYARERGLRVAGQGTGHNAGALGSLEDTVLIKTHRMRGVEIDARERRARVEAGVLWQEVVGPAAEHGLAALHGSAGDVGVVGYTLGGGLSFYARQYGTAASRALAFELVTADGELIRADRHHNAELFRAMCGGGGAFGIVTAMEFELFDLGPIQAGHLWFPLPRGREVFKAWSAWVPALPTHATSIARVVRVPDSDGPPEHLRGTEWALVQTIVLGGGAEADALLAPMRALGPVMDTTGTMAAQDMIHLHMDPPSPVPAAGDHQMLGALPAEAVDALFDNLGEHLLGYQVIHGGGAVAHLGGPYITFGVGITATPELEAAVRSDLAALRDALAPWATEREYLNFAEVPGREPSRLWEAETYARLRAVKRAIDPDGVIVSNHPIA